MLIRRDLRPAITAYYRFARAADDCADAPGIASAAKLEGLSRFEAGLAGDAAGAAEGLALRAELAALGQDASIRHARRLLDAFRQDAVGVTCASWTDLLAYCANSANPVGRFLLELHGEGPRGVVASDSLCTALQVLNHLQDLQADHCALGRIYLPLDWLIAAGGARDDLGAGRAGPALREAIDRTLDRCDLLLDIAARLPVALDSRRLAGEARTINLLARRLSLLLRRRDPLAARVRLSRLDFARAGAAGLREALRPRRAASPAAARRGRA